MGRLLLLHVLAKDSYESVITASCKVARRPGRRSSEFFCECWDSSFAEQFGWERRSKCSTRMIQQPWANSSPASKDGRLPHPTRQVATQSWCTRLQKLSISRPKRLW